LKLGEYVITESGLRVGHGDGEVLRHHLPDRRAAAERRRAGRDRACLEAPRREPRGGAREIEAGAANLARHIGIVNGFGLQAVVGVNKFPTDTEEELELVRRLATEAGAYAAEINTAFENGGDGATALAEAAVAAADESNSFDFTYALDAPIEEKIRLIATRVYGADGVELLPAAKQKAAAWADSDLARLPICMAKTHLSLSHDPALKNAPTGFTVTVRDLRTVHGRGLDRRALRRDDDDARSRQDARGLGHRHRRERRDGRAVLGRAARHAERRQRAGLPVGIVALAGRADPCGRAVHRWMRDRRTRRQFDAGPGGAGDDPVRLLPATDDAVEVERHVLSDYPHGPMKDPSKSVMRMTITIAAQTRQRPIMNGASQLTSFCSGSKSICLPMAPPLYAAVAGGGAARLVERAGGTQHLRLSLQFLVLQPDPADK
jgi:hypothetical protein